MRVSFSETTSTGAPTPRIALLQPPYTDEARTLLARMMPGDAPPIGLFRMFARNFPMAGAMHGWGRYELGRRLTLSLREREIVIDRTCALCGWYHAVSFAARATRLPYEPGAPRFAGLLPATTTTDR